MPLSVPAPVKKPTHQLTLPAAVAEAHWAEAARPAQLPANPAGIFNKGPCRGVWGGAPTCGSVGRYAPDHAP